MVTAITQRSVLLSTKTKKAHIPLHNQSNNVDHHVANQIHVASSFLESLFETKKPSTSLINNKPKIKHKGQDKKFIATAIVSGDNRSHENTEPILNQKEIKAYHKYGIDSAVHIFHRNNQWFSAITFGVYIYAWLASQAVE